MSSLAIRFLAYGLVGWGAEILWTAACALRRRPVDWRLPGTTTLWMFPIYGSAAFLFEPLHDALRGTNGLLRFPVYVLGLWAVEYAASWGIERSVGRPPWDYRHARWHLHGRIRWDYAPLWLLFVIVLEWTHDWLVKAAP
jgi:uncharacterized membrane protein